MFSTKKQKNTYRPSMPRKYIHIYKRAIILIDTVIFFDKTTEKLKNQGM